jgi:hypothetical protein
MFEHAGAPVTIPGLSDPDALHFLPFQMTPDRDREVQLHHIRVDVHVQVAARVLAKSIIHDRAPIKVRNQSINTLFSV